MITLLNKFKRTIENKLIENGEETKIFVSVENETNKIKYANDLVIFSIRECENTLEFETEQNLIFTLGLNLKSLTFLEYNEEYIFSYNDSTKITISI